MQADLFDDYPEVSQTTNDNVQQATSTNNYDYDDSQQYNDQNQYQQCMEDLKLFEAQESYGQTPQNGNQTANKPLTDIFVSPEQMVRREKLRCLEDDRLKQVREKDEAERVEKQEKQQKANQFLQEWRKQRTGETANRQKQNRSNQELKQQARKNQNDYKNSWDKVASNIAQKDGEYPGKKDVTQMRSAIMNKRADLQ